MVPGGKSYNAIVVGVHILALENYKTVNAEILEVKEFEKSGKQDFGWCQYGYLFYFTHPKYGKIEIARGGEWNNGHIAKVFDKLYMSSEYGFNIDSYKNEIELEKDVENYITFLKKQIKLFIENFNKASDPTYIRKIVDADNVINNLKSRLDNILKGNN